MYIKNAIQCNLSLSPTCKCTIELDIQAVLDNTNLWIDDNYDPVYVCDTVQLLSPVFIGHILNEPVPYELTQC